MRLHQLGDVPQNAALKGEDNSLGDLTPLSDLRQGRSHKRQPASIAEDADEVGGDSDEHGVFDASVSVIEATEDLLKEGKNKGEGAALLTGKKNSSVGENKKAGKAIQHLLRSGIGRVKVETADVGETVTVTFASGKKVDVRLGEDDRYVAVRHKSETVLVMNANLTEEQAIEATSEFLTEWITQITERYGLSASWDALFRQLYDAGHFYLLEFYSEYALPAANLQWIRGLLTDWDSQDRLLERAKRRSASRHGVEDATE